MVKRIFMIWLVLCTVGYGSAWAFHGHLNEAAEHHGSFTGADHAPGGDAGQPACDHCCHASAHIIALCPAPIDQLGHFTGTADTPYGSSALFHFTVPPDRPPRS